MTILITGAAGYLGTQLLRALLDEEAAGPRLSIRVLDRLDHGPQPLLSAIGRHADQVQVVVGDVADAAAVHACLDSTIDAVVHLAGIVGFPACDAAPQDADRTNVQGTWQIARRLEGRPLLFASTGSTYGKVEGVATEATPISPLTRYGRNKAEGERIAQDAGGVCFRLATLYGPSDRMRWDLLPHDFLRTAWRDKALTVYEGSARRTFLHVADAAQAFRAALLDPLPKGEVYNVGDPRGNRTKAEVAGIVQELTGCALRTTTGSDPDQRDYAVGYQKVATALRGWRPSRTLEDTLPEVLTWARVWR